MPQPSPHAPLMDLAPPQKSSLRFLPVILAGLFTTAIALGAVYALDTFADTNPMGWYANGILPFGALLVGIVASIGYGVASWYMGMKIRWDLMVCILSLQIIAYFIAQYISFAAQGPLVDLRTGRPVGFWQYYDVTTVNMTWKDSSHAERPSEPLGSMGYLLRFGEILGFVAGTLIGPALLLKVPYCELCQRYMKSKTLAVIPVSGGGSGADPLDAASAQSKELSALAAQGQVATFLAYTTPLRERESVAAKENRRIVLRLDHCPQCRQGHLRRIMTTGRGKQLKEATVGSVNVPRDFVTEIIAAPQYAAAK